MVREALVFGKTVIFSCWLVDERMLSDRKNLSEWHLYDNRLGWHAESFEHMVDLIRNPTPITDATCAFLGNYILHTIYGQSGKLVADVLLRLDAR